MPKAHLEQIREQFTRTAEVYARMQQATDERGLLALVAISGAVAEDRVLDVACGPGFLTMAFAKHCAAATGFDATEAFLDLARAEAKARGLENIAFEHGDAEALPFGDGCFDRVVCRAAFHHFSNPAGVLAEMARVSKPTGTVVVADMLGNEDAEAAALHDAVERLCDPTHVRALPASEFDRLAEGAGLTTALRVPTHLDNDLEEWIDHGAPSIDARAQIIARMESWLEGDPTGLNVRREDGRLHFTHQVAVFVLEPAA